MLIDRGAYQRLTFRQINGAADSNNPAEIGANVVEPPRIKRMLQPGWIEARRVRDHTERGIEDQTIEGISCALDGVPAHCHHVIIAKMRNSDSRETIKGLPDGVQSGRPAKIKPGLGEPSSHHAGTFGLAANRFSATQRTVSGRPK
ncbi:MAG: hypothetical protein PHE55_19185 [Methylococcaceae bacterium]|nr:hypothetical protein [Methylococcaceae bacterium]